MGTRFATAQLKLQARPIWLSEEMRLQMLFKLATCWWAPNTIRQVVPRGRACDGECMLAELQTGPRDEQNAVCRWPMTVGSLVDQHGWSLLSLVVWLKNNSVLCSFICVGLCGKKPWPWPWFDPHPSGCIGSHFDAILFCFELPPLCFLPGDSHP